jgi:hypothetical protein
MKRFFLTLAVAMISYCSYAQTNTFPLSGNVGIGTGNPSAKLDVLGVVRYGNGNTSSGSLSYGTSGLITLESSSLNTSIAILPSGNGNVMIGKTSQANTAYKLDINGSARVNEIVVNTTGADFVFDDKYPLPQLSEVKSYIDENHHLPGIPSAEQMTKEGFSVGEMNTKLLQKLEELTLYLIEQQHKNEEQDAHIKTLEATLVKLTANNSDR